MALRALFLDKIFQKELFDKYMEGTVDFAQYPKGDILLIESFIGKNTLKDLLNKISFTAINHETYEEQRADYSKKVCNQLTGQDNADFHGKRAVVSNNGEISLETQHFKDAKTYESGILKGRLAIRYDLYSNAQNTKEQLTKIITSIQLCIKNSNISKNAKQTLTNLYKKLEEKRVEIFEELKNMNKDLITKTIINPQHHDIIKEHFDEIYDMIRKAILNPEISKHINLGISFDPRTDTAFIEFSKIQLQINYEQFFTSKEIQETLYHNVFDKEKHRQLLENLITYFPEEIQFSAQKAIEYIDNR